MPTAHKQTQVKVNAFADAGIADLISALSEIEGLQTMESCQGDPNSGKFAFVIFTMGDWRTAGEFLFERVLGGMSPDLRSMVSLQVQAFDVQTARGSIDIDPHGLSLFTQYVRELTAAVARRSAVAILAHGDAVAGGIGTASSLCVPMMGVPAAGDEPIPASTAGMLADGHCAFAITA